MGSSLDPGDIKEGDDVYFECNVRANPAASTLTWFHEVNVFSEFFYALPLSFSLSENVEIDSALTT